MQAQWIPASLAPIDAQGPRAANGSQGSQPHAFHTDGRRTTGPGRRATPIIIEEGRCGVVRLAEGSAVLPEDATCRTQFGGVKTSSHVTWMDFRKGGEMSAVAAGRSEDAVVRHVQGSRSSSDGDAIRGEGALARSSIGEWAGVAGVTPESAPAPARLLAPVPTRPATHRPPGPETDDEERASFSHGRSCRIHGSSEEPAGLLASPGLTLKPMNPLQVQLCLPCFVRLTLPFVINEGQVRKASESDEPPGRVLTTGCGC